MMAEKTEFTLSDNSVTVAVQGETEMPFWKHDLKIKAALSLLSTVDKKDYYEDDKHQEFHESIVALRELLDRIEM
jgi:hypothetical protein